MISKFRIRTADIMIRIAPQFTPYNCSTTASCIQWQKCTYFSQKSIGKSITSLKSVTI